MRIWVGSRPELVCSAYKKYLLLWPWQQAVRIQFRFETVWCVREGDSLVCTDGSLLPFAQVHLPQDFKVLIGRNDPYQLGLDYNPDAKAFRLALEERAREQAKAELDKLLEQP